MYAVVRSAADFAIDPVTLIRAVNYSYASHQFLLMCHRHHCRLIAFSVSCRKPVIKSSSSSRVSPDEDASATTAETAAVYAVVRSAADFAIDPVTLSAPLIILIAVPNL